MGEAIKVLNLYGGIGGNRKLWDNVDVTAIENEPQIAKIYEDFFPNDKIIVTDAHKYLLEHFKEFDFIWSSPPCPSHSVYRKNINVERGQNKPIYPDMRLYEEILFLDGYFNGKWVIENVISYYKPLIKPQEVQRHYFWSNFHIGKPPIEKKDNIARGHIKEWEKRFGFNLDNYTFNNGVNKRTTLRNCVYPPLALHIFNQAFKGKQERLGIDG